MSGNAQLSPSDVDKPFISSTDLFPDDNPALVVTPAVPAASDDDKTMPSPKRSNLKMAVETAQVTLYEHSIKTGEYVLSEKCNYGDATLILKVRLLCTYSSVFRF
jgi:hypothetical protein